MFIFYSNGLWMFGRMASQAETFKSGQSVPAVPQSSGVMVRPHPHEEGAS